MDPRDPSGWWWGTPPGASSRQLGRGGRPQERGRGNAPAAPPHGGGGRWGGCPRWGDPAGATGATWTVGAWPRVAVVPFGGSVAINCSHGACPGGNGTLGLETPLSATAGAGGRRWQSFLLLNVSRWDPGPVTCHGRCGEAEGNASARILVYREQPGGRQGGTGEGGTGAAAVDGRAAAPRQARRSGWCWSRYRRWRWARAAT